jgi:hypothetical protein
MDHVAQRVQLPDVSHINTNHLHVPPIIVIQTQFPSEAPPSFWSEDGACNTLAIYLQITEQTRQELADVSTASPAVRLFAQWCERSRTDHKGLKLIGHITNLDDFGLPSWLHPWNAKPILIKPNHSLSLYFGTDYLEMDINVSLIYLRKVSSIYCIHLSF